MHYPVRRENTELATIAGMLHDIYSYSSMDTNDHAHKTLSWQGNSYPLC